MYYAIENYEEAKEYYLKCIDLVKEAFSDDSPRLLQPYLGLANCCMGLNDYENAIDYLLQLKAFSDEDMLLKRIIYYKVGTCYVILGKYDTGIEHFKKAIQLCDENGETDLGYIYVDMSNTYHLMGKEDEALYYGNQGASGGAALCIQTGRTGARGKYPDAFRTIWEQFKVFTSGESGLYLSVQKE